MLQHVDPFVGSEVTSLCAPGRLAATWWSPKPLIGNTHPGACFPLGMVSACAYSGAYPTGYGRYDLSTEGVPPALNDRLAASGFTHFQQSGTGAIRKYYNYFRVTPMIEPLDDLGASFGLDDEHASPGYYAATLDNGIRAEITVGPKSAIHRYTFPTHPSARVVVDLSLGGLAIPYGETIPLRAHLESAALGVATGEIVVEGVPLAVHMECDSEGWRQMLWYDRRLMPAGARLDLDHIRHTTLRPFGIMWVGPAQAGQTVEIRMGFSLRGTEQAKANLRKDCGVGGQRFDKRLKQTRGAWQDALDAVRVTTGNEERRSIFATALYHSLIKPCFARDESPFWPSNGPFVFDISTMWDIYKTQLPLLTALMPDRAIDLANALLTICEQEGNLPIGYRMARGSDRFSRQGSALAHTFLADLCALEIPGVDWDWALVTMQTDLRRAYGEDYLLTGSAHPISHTLDLAFGYWCTARVAERVEDDRVVAECEELAAGWPAAFGADGLLIDSNFYEGVKHNYSFRLQHDMAARISLAGGDDAFVTMLDAFFGVGAGPVTQPGLRPSKIEMNTGYALGRFEGLNNEPDMEAPWAYHYAGRPDRTAEVVHDIVNFAFGTGRGGLPGNDDSGGLSSWYVWASLGLFPVAGQNLFLLHPPSFASASLRMSRGTLTISTAGFAEPTPGGPVLYVQSATFNGQAVEAFIDGGHVHAGGELHYVLGPTPSAWGTETRPPSHPHPALPTHP
ncbi:glycoside hydrolase family 92 protein [Demequina sp. TTPB684]|uniref:glycoside hydrolase domain-containing protein n=1 Tax=unclassified Demequina TaxID=2620311 RepID=UPI001CF23831|nr:MULTISPECIES: glycoside hydrolase domain-containing protein [unclassified Demequina]MCB2412434.1 glycoside hydrolase family 92 protein [Demequina sp. TTPB684]UPU87410.1 glycoside hydrolase family 92 protein [Demequina sp. TMPB413]